jgi:hypothetical protein
MDSVTPCLHLVPIGFEFGISFVHIRNFFIATDVFGRSHFNASNLAFWQLGVAPGPLMMLFATWGRSIHLDQLLIVEADVRHHLRPQNLTRNRSKPCLWRDFCAL